MKLSIITINLNDKDGLERTINSVRSQSFKDFEFIIVDGDSTDGSKDILEMNADIIHHLISEKDNGIYDAMNKGIKIAQGEYLYFLNAGDTLTSYQVLESVFQEEVHSPFICTNFYTINKGTKQLHTPYKNRDWSFSIYDIYSTYLCHQAFFIHRSMFDKYGLYSTDLKITSDWELFFIAIGINHEAVSYKDINLVEYNTEGLSSTIGGAYIYSEKQKVAKRRLSIDLAKRLDRLYQLEQSEFVVEAYKKSKLINFIVRLYCKFTR